MKDINLQSEEAWKTPNGASSKRSTPAYISVKLSKTKTKKIIKSNKRKMTYHVKEILNKIESVYFIRYDGAQKKMRCTYKVPGGKEYQQQILYPAKLSLQNEGNIKKFPAK